MKILYFAWMREHTGCSSEEIKLPAEIRTIGDLASYLRGRSAGHDAALRNLKTVRVAQNRTYARLGSPIEDSDEIAFFPPVTGG